MAERSGYAAGAELLEAAQPELREYLFHEHNTDWIFLTPGARTCSTCLVLASGWGALSRALCRYIPEVWSLDHDLSGLRFQAAYCHHDQLQSMRPIYSLPLRLPFANASLDMVVVQNGWSWLVGIYGLAAARHYFDAWLRECRRVLQPGGTFMWSMNRFQNSQARATERHEPSVRAWRVRLRDSGFAEPQLHWCYPDIHGPKLMGAWQSRSLRALLQFQTRDPNLGMQGSLRVRWAAPLRNLGSLVQPGNWLGRRIAPGVIGFAHAGEPVPADPLRRVTAQYRLCYCGSDKLVWLNPQQKEEPIIKLPRFQEDFIPVQAQQYRLRRYGLQAVTFGQFGDQPCYFEPGLRARPVNSRHLRQCRDGLAWLMKFQRQTEQGRWEREAWVREIREQGQRFRALAQRENLARAGRRAIERLLDVTCGAHLPRVAEHGDFWPGNVLWHGQHRVTVIDWECYRGEGDPFFDLTLYCHSLWLSWKHGCRRKSAHLPELLDWYEQGSGFAPELVWAYFPYALMRKFMRSQFIGRQYLAAMLEREEYPSADECSKAVNARHPPPGAAISHAKFEGDRDLEFTGESR